MKIHLIVVLAVTLCASAVGQIRTTKPAMDPMPTTGGISVADWRAKYSQRVIVIFRSELKKPDGQFGRGPTILEQPMWALSYYSEEGLEWLPLEDAVGLIFGMTTPAVDDAAAKEIVAMREALIKIKTILQVLEP